MKKIIAMLFCILAALIAIFLFGYSSLKKSDIQKISTFEECQKAGFPVMESYPRQCTLPGGKFFTETLLFASCKSDDSCPIGEYCANAACEPMGVQTQCLYDNDCMLLDMRDRFACCSDGSCRDVDYADSAWRAVNKGWFEQRRKAVCTKQCGQKSDCAVRAINLNFAARCVNSVCAKIAKPYVK